MVSNGALAAASGVGLTGIACAGAYSMGAFGGSDSPQEAPPTSTMSQTFQAIRKTDDVLCVKDFLPELYDTIKNSVDNSTPPKDATEIKDGNQIEDGFFETTNYSLNNCLVVNWDKKLGSNGKWQGNFRYLWGFNHKDQALVIFNSLETSSTETKLQLSGGVYFVKKGGEKGTSWVVYKYKKWPPSTSITQSDFESKFPKVGDGIGEKDKFAEGKDYWGFVSGATDLSNICLNCQESQLTTHKSFRGKWKWENSDPKNHKPTDWLKSPNSWFKDSYPDISNFQKLMDGKFNGMKGKWTNLTLQPNTTS